MSFVPREKGSSDQFEFQIHASCGNDFMDLMRALRQESIRDARFRKGS
jgi:hypothetical protein